MTSGPNEGELTERAQLLLKALVERYVDDGQPVGSRTLSRSLALSLSPATIRNVMSDLEEMGFVVSPHTSAGRIPTVRGYRYFVDQLLSPEKPNRVDSDRIRESIEQQALSRDDAIQSASDLLSRLTQLAAVVTVPRRDIAVLRQIEFLALSENRVLVILVVNQHEVQNRILRMERGFSASELEKAANYLNAIFAGKDLYSIRDALLSDVIRARDSMDQFMVEAVDLAQQALGDRPGDERRKDEYRFAGGTHLLENEAFSSMDKIKALFEAFDGKRDLLHLFDECLRADGVQIFIGEESGYSVFEECSVVTAPYEVEGEQAGVLGVIGPTRMAYNRIVPLVESTARMLSSVLKKDD